jgi:menaquinone-dependent protoporphyrinogen IX oxidase
MSRILVTYSTNSGSTAEVAEAVAAELTQLGHSTDVCLIKEVKNLVEYDAVIIGAPMILGWQTTARKFVKKYRTKLAGKKVAYFACAMRLTQTKNEAAPDVSLALDPNLVTTPAKPSTLTIKEWFTSIGYYLNPILDAAPGVKPVGVAFFYGKLEMYKLKWWQAAFVMVIVRAVPGDYRDWDFIKGWARTIGNEI